MNSEIKALFEEATIAVQKLENKIREEFNTPITNLNPNEYKKIRVPYNYIRSKISFINNYHLSQLIGKNRVLYNNIAYSLQLTDFNNFIINRLELYGALKNQFLKNCIGQNFAIVEAIIMEVIFDLGKFCVINKISCKYSSTCTAFINCQNNMKQPTAKVILANKIKVSNEFLTIYSIILKIRDRIHMRLIETNEYFDEGDDLTIKMYNDSIYLLRYLKANFLDDLSSFLSYRDRVCKKY